VANTRTIILAITFIAVIVVAAVGATIFFQGQPNASPTPQPTATPTPEPTTSSSPAPTGTTVPPFPITLTDDENNTVTLNAYPQRIVSLAPGNTQMVCAVGAVDILKGVTDYDNYPYNFTAWIEAGNMTSIGNYYDPAIEPIVALNPDLVLASLGSSDAANQLRGLGYQVLTLNPPNLNGIMADMLKLGQATGHTADAQAAVDVMQAKITDVTQRVQAAVNRPLVYHEVWSDPYMSAGKGSFIGELIAMAGGQNIFENATLAYPTVNAEEIISYNPDVIIFPTQMGVTSFWGNYSSVAQRPGWDSINAVVNQRMHTINGDLIDQPGPRQADALLYIAQMLHPEIFGTYTDQQ
jgi:iron complex transport system substrate-binding protein